VLVVAYVVDKCLESAVEQMVRAAGFDRPIVIVAVESLPKAKLVEIRAVAGEKDVEDADENIGEDGPENAGNVSNMVVESYSGEDEIAADILLQGIFLVAGRCHCSWAHRLYGRVGYQSQ
jgi:hypothetical protein